MMGQHKSHFVAKGPYRVSTLSGSDIRTRNIIIGPRKLKPITDSMVGGQKRLITTFHC